ncbi:MAG: HDOD domain-containing protein [Pseudomonadota bacterium]|nr:HDOD domain-containing protein [Pseudomonadota bacterium]
METDRRKKKIPREIEAYLHGMPSLSTTMRKVLAICNDPAASANDLNRIIALDPVLTGKVLKLINSAYYSPGESISSLTRAIIILGMNTVKNLALSSAVMDNLCRHEQLSAKVMNDFWMHSLSTGVIAKILAARKGVASTEREEYFVAGLLHDLGKIPLMSLYMDRYRQLILGREGGGGRSFLHGQEEEAFGVGHCHVGTLIAEKWRLSPQITVALRDHHRNDSDRDYADSFSVIVTAANLIAHCLYPQRSALDREDLIGPQIALVGVEPGDIPAMAELVDRELGKARIFLELH